MPGCFAKPWLLRKTGFLRCFCLFRKTLVTSQIPASSQVLVPSQSLFSSQDPSYFAKTWFLRKTLLVPPNPTVGMGDVLPWSYVGGLKYKCVAFIFHDKGVPCSPLFLHHNNDSTNKPQLQGS